MIFIIQRHEGNIHYECLAVNITQIRSEDISLYGHIKVNTESCKKEFNFYPPNKLKFSKESLVSIHYELFQREDKMSC